MYQRKIYLILFVLGVLLTQFVIPVGASSPPEIASGEPGAAPQGDPRLISEQGLNAKHPAVAYNTYRNQYLVVWYNDRPGNDDIQGQKLDRNGKPLGGKFFISAGAGHDRRYPDIAYDSKNDQYLVVWEDYDNASMVPGYGIHARRISGTGEVMDANDIVVRGKGSIYSAAQPAVEYAYTSNNFLVVWSETFHPSPLQKDIYGQVIGINGALQGNMILISDDTGDGDYRTNPDVAYNRHANRFLVIFSHRYHVHPIWGITGQQLTGAGDLWGTDFIIELCSANAGTAKVAALPSSPTDDKFMVTYELEYEPANNNIISMLIKENGDLNMGSKGYTASAGLNETLPAIGSNENSNNYLITWKQPDPDSMIPYMNIMGRKRTHDGTYLGSNEYIAGEFAGMSAVAGGQHGDYLVALEDEHQGSNILAILYRDMGQQIFQDVPPGHWAFGFINRLYGAGITAGCSMNPLKYCPDQTVTRAQMAIFLERGMRSPDYNPPAVGPGTGFNDVAPNAFAAAWIKQLAADGITSGCGGGNYCPNNPVTRAQMAIFLLRAKYGAGYTPPPVGQSTGFNDVAPDNIYAPWIKQLAAEGITAGCGGGNYCPNNAVTRAQMAVFLVKTFNLP